MTFAEIQRSLSGAIIEAVIDGCGESATIGLYKKHADDLYEIEELAWPDDWPEWMKVSDIRALGIDVITA